jgi:hypothetical protein
MDLFNVLSKHLSGGTEEGKGNLSRDSSYLYRPTLARLARRNGKCIDKIELGNYRLRATIHWISWKLVLNTGA